MNTETIPGRRRDPGKVRQIHDTRHEKLPPSPVSANQLSPSSSLSATLHSRPPRSTPSLPKVPPACTSIDPPTQPPLGASTSISTRSIPPIPPKPSRKPSDSSSSSASSISLAAEAANNPAPSQQTAMSTSSSAREGTTPTQRVSRAKKGKRVHACDHPGCEKVFTRAEHLRRHQLNHSTEVFYKCDLCERTFVRQDLLSRHTDRHATQTRKAVQTLALAQRHRQFSSHFGINGIAVLAPPPPPTSDYGGNAHVFDSNSHTAPRVQTADIASPIMPAHSSHQSSPTTSLVTSPHSTTSYNPSFSPALSVHPADSPLDFSSTTDSTPSPSANLRRAHLPFHLQHNEPQRPADGYLLPVTSHPEVVPQRPLALPIDHQMYAKPLPTWENYAWLFDDSMTDQQIMNNNQNQDPALSYINPMERAHYQNMGAREAQSNGGRNGAAAVPFFQSIDERTRSEVLLLVNVSSIYPGAHASLASMQYYLRIYWTKFHPKFPILHRPTFVPGLHTPLLIAIVLAIGASFMDEEAHQFAMALYDKVAELVFNSEEYNPNDIAMQQTILLTDIFAKLRSTRGHFENSQLDDILLNLLRRSEVPTGDSLEQVRRYQRDGLEFNYQNHWQNWMQLESRKRVALFFFLWDVQQEVLFGRDMCQTVFDLRAHLPCDEFLWESDTAVHWADYVTQSMQAEYPPFLAALKSFLDPRRKQPTLNPFGFIFIVFGLLSIGLDLHRRGSAIAPNTNEPVMKKAKVIQSLELWKDHFEQTMRREMLPQWHRQGLLYYNMAYISLHSDISTVLLLAGDHRFFRRNSNASDEFYQARRNLQHWANSHLARIATWHAVQCLSRCLGQFNLQEEMGVPWCLYMAALVCWTYGNLSVDSIPRVQNMSADVWDASQETGLYLQQMQAGGSWENLSHVGEIRKRTRGLLTIVRKNIEGTRWGLLRESAEILKRINTGRNGSV